MPDIIVASRSLDCNFLFPPYWLSEFSQAWMMSNFAGISNFLYDLEDYSVPLYYLHGDSPLISTEPVQFIYISDQMPHENYPTIPIFESDTNRIEVGGYINYTLIHPDEAEVVSWEFEGGDPSSWSAYSAFPPPPIYYNTAGIFDVSVEYFSLGWGCTKYSENYIFHMPHHQYR